MSALKLLLLGRDLGEGQRLLLAMGFQEYVVLMHLREVDPLNPLQGVDLSPFDAVVVNGLPTEVVVRIATQVGGRLPLYILGPTSLRRLVRVSIDSEEVAVL